MNEMQAGIRAMIETGELKPLNENIGVSLWLAEQAKKNPLSLAMLLEDNRDRLYKAFRQEKPQTDAEDPHLVYWQRMDDNLHYYIVVDTEKGHSLFYLKNANMSYEEFVNHQKLGHSLQGFLFKIIREISGV